MDFKIDLFCRRLILAVLWNVAVQTILAVALVFVIQLYVNHEVYHDHRPLSWITSTVHGVFGWKMGLNIFLISLVTFFQAHIYGTYYTSPLPKYFTRFSMFLNLFSIQNLTFSFLYALSGYFTMVLYSSMAKSNFNILKKMCENYAGQCLMEQSLFLQFAGMWMGLYYFLNIQIFGSNILVFPHIHQDKFQQMKLAICNIISMGFKHSVLPVLYYCIFYYLCGSKPRRVVSDVYSLYLEDPPLDNVRNLIASGIWIGLWFYTSLFFISMYTMRTVFNIFLTSPMIFPIESISGITLRKALAQRSQFIGYLGAQDLRIMAMTDAERRLQVFTLSLPGGHPRNWTNILEICLHIINRFNKELDKINEDLKAIGLESSINKKLIDTPSPLVHWMYSRNIRNMAESPQFLYLKEYNRDNVEKTLKYIAKEKFNAFLQWLCQKPGISYFFGELTDTKLKFLLMQSQPVMWTCEGLAFVAAASLREDKYGSVQNDLPVIIETLINLKQNLDKLIKPGFIPRKHILRDEIAIKMRTALISAVKRSLYKIVITFSKFMHEIPLEHEVQAAAQPFLTCREA